MADPLDDTPLQYRHLTRQQQSTANRIVEDFGSNFSQHARRQGKALQENAARNPEANGADAKRARGNRLVAIADVHKDKPMTLRSAAQHRIDALTRAAQPENKYPNEPIGGAGWYFDAHQEIASKAHGIPVPVAAAASSAMSPGADPESERKATGALASAHTNENASVHFSAGLVAHLRSLGHSVPVPVGSTVHVSKVPAHLIPALAHPTSRHLAQAHSSGVDWAGIGSISNGDNIAKATRILRGETPVEDAQNPYGAPKTWSYADNMANAVPGTAEHAEYMMRAQHLGEVRRGETHGGQMMFDYHGLRGSNEGLLSNRGHTAEDSWMRAVSVAHSNPSTMKGAGDINPTTKTIKVEEAPGKQVVHNVNRDERVKAGSVYHAWNNAATHKATDMLQKQHGLEYTVPSTLVQETAWTQTRREVGADPEWNASQRKATKASRAEARANRVPAPQTADLLPGTNTAGFKQAARGMGPDAKRR